MMNPSVMNLQHRLALVLSVGLPFDQRQEQWIIYLFWGQLQALFFFFLRGGWLFYSLPLRGRGRSSCPVKVAEQWAHCTLKGTPRPLPSKHRVPHVTSFLARAPSSILFCEVRNTHKFLAFCKLSEEFGQCSSPSWIIPHLLCFRNARAFLLLPAALASVPFEFV